jgi:TonB family protein
MKVLGHLFALILLAYPLAAQHVLVVKEDGVVSPVVMVEGYKPFISKDGKLVATSSHAYSMIKAGEYLPVHISVKNKSAKTSYMTMDGVGEMNKTFEFHCELECAYDLEGVFMVLLLDSENAGKGIFLRGIDKLEAREPKTLDLQVPTNENLGAGHYKIHLFVKGREVFNSTLGFGEMENALKRMVRDRIKGVQDAPAQPFIGPAPEYPRALYKKKVEGTAVLSFKITPDGSIDDPVVTEATQPEFGAAAMAVIKQWRFLPKVVNGHPVEAKAKMPFKFTPPKK